MKPEWILVANASIARLFRRDSPSDPLVAMATLEHPESRLKAGQLADDRPGHEAADHSRGGNRFEPRSDVRKKEHRRFAHEVAARLDAGLAAGEYGSLWLFASNPFLGELNAELSEAVTRQLRGAVDTDLTALGLDEVERRLRKPAAH